MKDGRITWRHDSILLAIYRGVLDRIQEAMKAKGEVATAIHFKSSSGNEFTALHKQAPLVADTAVVDSEGRDPTARANIAVPPPQRDVLAKATDWKVQFDLALGEESRKERPFPPEIAIVTGKGSRPDGIIWSMETKTVIWIELTSPWEENFKSRHDFKFVKYNQLAIDLREGKHFGVKWTVLPFYVEVGARGPVHELGWGRMCTQLGITGAARRRLTTAVQTAAIYCSHYIFLCRFHKHWEQQALRDTWENSAN